MSGEQSVEALMSAAERAHRAGQMDEAVRLLEDVLHADPDEPRALNSLGIRALKAGDPQRARDLLSRAAQRVTDQPALWLNLAMACRTLGDENDEMAALERALALDPSMFLALLQKAQLLERRKDPKAAGVYQAALMCAPPVEQLPPPLRAALDHARDALHAHNAALDAFLTEHLANVRATQATARTERFDECIDLLLGKRRVYVQQPTFLHFPRLPAIPFYGREDFPWLSALEAAAPAIREELLQVLDKDSESFVPYIARPEGAPVNQWAELNHSRRWSVYSLWRDGEQVEESCRRCPQTAAALAQAPMADVPGRAPSAFFSLLHPKTHIPPHTGVTNTRLIVHLPLIVPPGCRFRVGSEVREWEEGKAWVFDDTIEHEAWNDSDELRAILIFDIWNMYMTADERDLVRSTIEGLETFYGGNTPMADLG